MSNKDLEKIYALKVLKEEGEEIFSQNDEPTKHNPHMDAIASTFDKDDKDPLDDHHDPLDEDESDPKKYMKELVAAVQYLLDHWQNVKDGAKTEKAFIKLMDTFGPELRGRVHKVDLS
jgi:hypothetical protein